MIIINWNFYKWISLYNWHFYEKEREIVTGCGKWIAIEDWPIRLSAIFLPMAFVTVWVALKRTLNNVVVAFSRFLKFLMRKMPANFFKYRKNAFRYSVLIKMNLLWLLHTSKPLAQKFQIHIIVFYLAMYCQFSAFSLIFSF